MEENQNEKKQIYHFYSNKIEENNLKERNLILKKLPKDFDLDVLDIALHQDTLYPTLNQLGVLKPAQLTIKILEYVSHTLGVSFDFLIQTENLNEEILFKNSSYYEVETKDLIPENFDFKKIIDEVLSKDFNAEVLRKYFLYDPITKNASKKMIDYTSLYKDISQKVWKKTLEQIDFSLPAHKKKAKEIFSDYFYFKTENIAQYSQKVRKQIDNYIDEILYNPKEIDTYLDDEFIPIFIKQNKMNELIDYSNKKSFNHFTKKDLFRFLKLSQLNPNLSTDNILFLMLQTSSYGKFIEFGKHELVPASKNQNTKVYFKLVKDEKNNQLVPVSLFLKSQFKDMQKVFLNHKEIKKEKTELLKEENKYKKIFKTCQKIIQCPVIFDEHLEKNIFFDEEKFEVRIKKGVPENFGVTEFAKLSVKIFEDYYSTLEPLSLKDNHSEIDFLKLETDATTFLILDYLGLEDTSYDFDYLDNLKQPLISKQKLLLKSFLTRVQHRKNNFISVYEKELNQIISSENEREKNENSITKEIEMSKEKMNRLSKLREKDPSLTIQNVVESKQNYDVPEQELVLEKSNENEE